MEHIELTHSAEIINGTTSEVHAKHLQSIALLQYIYYTVPLCKYEVG